MSTVDLRIRLRTEAYDVTCGACGSRAHLVGDPALYGWIDAHHDPRMRAVYFRVNGGPVEKWQCRNPRNLRSRA